MKYCEFCGNQIKNKTCTCPEALAQAEKNNKGNNGKGRLPITLIAVAAVIAVIAIVCLVSIGSKADPFEYVNVTYNGYHTAGSAKVSFNEDALISEIIGEPDDTEKGLTEWFTKYDAYTSGLEVSCSPKDNLSNGDVVTVTIVASGEAKSKIKSGEQTYVVEGLPEIEVIDIFKNIQLAFDGLSGEATAKIELLSEDEVLKACQFTVDKGNNLVSGDLVTVSIQNADALIDKYHCIPEETTKTYTVPALAQLVKDVNSLPIETIKEFIAQFIIDETHEPEAWFDYSETSYYKTYLGTLKADKYDRAQNRLYIFVTYDEYMRDEYWRTVYTPLEFRNIIVNTDGSVELRYEDGVNSVFFTDMESALENMSELYDVVEVHVG